MKISNFQNVVEDLNDQNLEEENNSSNTEINAFKLMYHNILPNLKYFVYKKMCILILDCR